MDEHDGLRTTGWAPVPLMVHTAVRGLFCTRCYLTVSLRMQNRTETLEVGSRAPEFALPSANSEGKLFALSIMLGNGPVIVEFLRGTW
jgi:hypothetical protein